MIRAQRTKPSKFRSREKSEEGKEPRFLTGAAFYCAELNLTLISCVTGYFILT